MGEIGYDTAHLLGALVLLTSFALLSQRRLSALISAFALQSALLAAAAAWQGLIQDSPHLFVTAAIALLLKAVAIPLALRRVMERFGIQRAAEPALGVGPTLVAGVSLVTLSLLLVIPTTAASAALTREDLALALSVVLLGLLMMITRRNAIGQVVGFMSLENGLILAAVGVKGMPLVVEMSVAFAVMVAFIIFGIFFFQIRERFDSLDLRRLDDVHAEEEGP
ncbi:MAG TPA: hydrogenase-4 component E [Azospirillaceae bacterium]|nr:hydrogenase-4 component E [Azospirillaceae bacterium]